MVCSQYLRKISIAIYIHTQQLSYFFITSMLIKVRKDTSLVNPNDGNDYYNFICLEVFIFRILECE